MSKGEVNSAFGKRDWKKRQGLELHQLGVSLYLIPYSSINVCLHIIHKYIETHDQHMKNPLLHYFIKTAKSCIWRQGNAGRGLPGKYQFSRLFWRFLIHTNYDVILIKCFLFFRGPLFHSQYRVDDACLMSSCSVLVLFHCSACVVPFVIY